MNKIINEKDLKRLYKLALIGGIGALWLSCAWFRTASGKDLSGPAWEDQPYLSYVFWYYIFNSILLILNSLALRKKLFKIWSILSLILGFSVIVSLVLFDMSEQGAFLNHNLFVYTTFTGIFFGVLFGGPIFIPIFLGSVFRNMYLSVKYLRGSLEFTNDILPITVQNNSTPQSSDK